MTKSKVSTLISQLSNSKINKLNLIVEAFSTLTYDELKKFDSRIPQIFRGLLKIPYLKRKSFSDIFTSGKVLWSNTVDMYGALSIIILNNAKELNKYIALKESLDYATAVQNYQDAYSLLKQIETEIGSSINMTYYLLKLTRLDKGITASTQFYNKICRDNRMLSGLSNVAFKSASIDIPFEADLDGLYRSLSTDGEIRDFFTAFVFPYKRTKGDGWLKLLLYTSLIDLYEGFVLQLSSLEPDRLKTAPIAQIILDVTVKIKDRRLSKLKSLVHVDESSERSFTFIDEMELLEHYYSGDYEYVYEKGYDYLKIHPLEGQIIDVFYRSCIKLNRMPDDIFIPDSLAYRVHTYYHFSLVNEDFSDFLRSQLKNLCIAWFSIPGLRHIYQLYNDMDAPHTDPIYRNYWRYSYIPEIRDASFYNDSNEAVDYMISMGYDPNNASQIKILQQILVDEYNQTFRLLYGFGYDDLISYKESFEKHEHIPIVTGCVVSQLFNGMVSAGMLSEAVDLYVRYRLDNPFIKICINKDDILRTFTDAVDATIADQLKLSVFYTMINADVYKRYLAYKRYLRRSEVSKASDIDDLSDPLLQYFAGKGVDRNVLTLHVLAYDTEDDIVSERIELCKKLYSATSDKIYSEEITSLIKEQEVKTLAQQVNDSKIHVDVQSLINSEFKHEKLMYDTLAEIDDNLLMYEQKNLEWLFEYITKQYEGKSVVLQYELPTVKYKRMLLRQMFLNIRDKFLFNPIYGLDKYLSARIRHGTLITQLRNHFLTYSLVTNKKDGGDYQYVNPWTQKRCANLLKSEVDEINKRMLQFTIWLDDQLKYVKEERIQIRTERNDSKLNGLFDYSDSLMIEMIDGLEDNSNESFDSFMYASIDLLWKWTSQVLQNVRAFFQEYEVMVVDEMTNLQTDVVALMGNSTTLIANFKDAITACKTAFQSDVAIVTSWFKPEQANVRFFTIQQAVDTSLAVINRINQDALSFSEIVINDDEKYDGVYFNAFHDVFHDMMNNILGYEAKRSALKGGGKIIVNNIAGKLLIEVSNPIDSADIEGLHSILRDQKNFPDLIAGGKTRKENNSGCIKIYSTVMYTLGAKNKYENCVENGHFIAKIEIDKSNIVYDEDIIG